MAGKEAVFFPGCFLSSQNPLPLAQPITPIMSQSFLSSLHKALIFVTISLSISPNEPLNFLKIRLHDIDLWGP